METFLVVVLGVTNSILLSFCMDFYYKLKNANTMLKNKDRLIESKNDLIDKIYDELEFWESKRWESKRNM